MSSVSLFCRLKFMQKASINLELHYISWKIQDLVEFLVSFYY